MLARDHFLNRNVRQSGTERVRQRPSFLVPDPLRERKKSELVAALEKLFTDAADGKLEDKTLAERVNRWLPSNLRKEESAKAA